MRFRKVMCHSWTVFGRARCRQCRDWPILWHVHSATIHEHWERHESWVPFGLFEFWPRVPVPVGGDQRPSTFHHPSSWIHHSWYEKNLYAHLNWSQNFVHSPMKCPSTRVIDVWRNHIWPTGVVKEYSKIKELIVFLISWILILVTFILVPGCGGNLGATSQDNTFTSPGYPNGYANNLNCLWVITTLPGNRIWLNLTNLDIEGHFTCSFDKIIIYDSECFLWLSFHCFIVTTKLETCVNCNKSKDDCNKL